MVLVLMSVGALLTVVGLASVAYGLPYNDFGLGNILVVAGTTATVAGLILIALSAVLRELIAIRTALTAGAADRAEAPGRLRSSEPPLAAAPDQPSAAVAAERLRAAPSRAPVPPAPVAPASPPLPQAELPPQPPLRAPPTPPPLRRSDLDSEPAAYRTPVVAPLPAAAPSSDIGLPDSLRARPPAAGRGDDTGDLGAPAPDWTQDPLGEPMSVNERKRFFGWTRRRQTVSSDAEAPHAEAAPPAFDRAPPPPPRAPSRPAPPPRPEPPAAEDTGGVAVLKSGVIDGMGYTLYTDGSIDAEFAQGVLRFGSIEDLRRHLEQYAG
ncbi:MAG: hypothetical protein HXX10_18555 [Rhodoplanes sp.]|uniref:hypothetical protein n=1 Tax=Rhodoplanes sp. TaxID=1968906 RepID=UPI0017A6515B|nr:hypothetical protein [Rhodoplanes sp.]NVO16038.1 hypothetical protein [Rhodoplanes sp.]